jgi:hypothetical protein
MCPPSNAAFGRPVSGSVTGHRTTIGRRRGRQHRYSMHAGDTYVDVLNHLGQLYPLLPELRLKGTHRRIAHLAHGWYMRTHRGIGAVLLLREEGYAAESWPIRRSVLEHVVALKWLAAEGNVVADVVRRANAISAERRKKAASQAGCRSASLPIFEDVIADKAATEEFKRFDELHNFAPRCARYGTPNDLASYMIDTAHSPILIGTQRPRISMSRAPCSSSRSRSIETTRAGARCIYGRRWRR